MKMHLHMLHIVAVLLDRCGKRPRPTPLVIRLLAVSSDLPRVAGRKKADDARVGADPVDGPVEVGGFRLGREHVREEEVGNSSLILGVSMHHEIR